MKKTRHIYTLVIFVLFFACNSNKEVKKENSKVEAKIDGKYCFLKTVENDPMVIDGKIIQRMIDSTQLSFTIKDTIVKGKFNYLPAEQDFSKGKFSGNIDENKKIKAIYVFDSEGDTYKVGLIILLKVDKVFIKIVKLEFNTNSKKLEVLDNDSKFEQLAKIKCSE